MLKQYYHVDEDGYVLETYVYDDASVPPNHFEGWGSGIESPRWDFEQGKWIDEKPAEDRLQEVKNKKFKELDDICTQQILGYFTTILNGQVYTFSFDSEAQFNFNGALSLFNAKLIETVQWTAWQDGKAKRVTLNYEDFLKIILPGFQHKDEKIFRLRNMLEPYLNSLETIEEVEALTWDTEVPEEYIIRS
ncbi:hypothetical protein [Phage f2b1]|nr:hypothetical protein [Phage f2b1]